MPMLSPTHVLPALLGLICCILVIWTSSVEAARPRKPPLIGEESSGKNRRTADCHFGKRVYELEETWHPDLGPPFGVMYCIRCECMAVQKKKRIAGRTLCKNIKNECPKPTCDEPVLLPGRCCKVCLEEGAIGLGPLKEDVSQGKDMEDDDKQMKDYAAVLTRRSGTGREAPTSAALAGPATGRFTFQKRHLYFSLVLPPATSSSSTPHPPRYIQFLSEDGNILEEQELGSNDYFNATGKICGVWRKVPRVYKQLLRDEKLWVALLDDKDSGESISGRVSRYKALSSELLSALLVPVNGAATCAHGGCGGTAAVSMASASNSIHVTVAVSGLVPKGSDVDAFVVRLESLETGSNQPRQIEEIVTVQKPQEVNVVEVRSVLEGQEMRMLLRGHVVLTVHAKRNPELRLQGVIGSRVACDLFDSLVTWSDSLDEPAKPSPAAALAWFYMSKSGNIQYHIHLQGFKTAITKVTLETAPPKNKRPRLVEDVTASLTDSWLNGTLARLSAKDYELLYEGEMYINVATGQSESEVRGRIVPRIAHESHLSMNSGPVLLSATNGTRSGIGWVNVDHQCNLHYDVSIGNKWPLVGVAPSRNRDQPTTLSVLELIDVPRLPINGQPGIGSSSPSGIALMDTTGQSAYENGNILYLPNIRLLDEFSGHQVENSVGDLSKLSLVRLDAGVAYLKLTEAPVPATPSTEYQGWLTHVRVPSACLPTTAAQANSADGAGEQSLGPGYVFDRQDDNEIPQTSRCFYENKLYDDGAQWTAEHDRCMMCSCQRGRVVCDPIVCPALTCGTASVIHPPGDCCPMCQNVTAKVETTVNQERGAARRGCHFDGDQKFHPAGSRWHPYLPPFGFSKCAICVCDPVTLKVQCTKQTCPPLNCPESEAYRADPMACCKQCPTPATTPVSTAISTAVTKDALVLGEEAQIRSEADIVAAGGCRFKGDVFENGEEWHPRIQPWGEMRCINCSCKDGKVKCKRKKCLKTRCSGSKSTSSPSSHLTAGVGSGDDCCPACTEEGPSTTSISPLTTSKDTKLTENDKKKRQREGRSRTRLQRQNRHD